MYILKTKVGNSEFQTTIDETGLTPEQIQERGQSAFLEAISFNRAKIHLKKQDEIDGKKLKDIISEPLKISWEEILPPVPTEEELKEKVYELPDLEGLTRLELLEQQIITERKLAAINDKLTALEADEKEKIEKSLKEDKGKK
jgi:hypothetical protein